MKFTEQEIGLSKILLQLGLQSKEQSMALRASWINNRYISAETTYAEVTDNDALMEAFRLSLILGLTNEVDRSRWGMGIVSDFWLAMCDNDFADTLQNDYQRAVDATTYEVLRKQRRSVRSFITKLRVSYYV